LIIKFFSADFRHISPKVAEAVGRLMRVAYPAIAPIANRSQKAPAMNQSTMPSMIIGLGNMLSMTARTAGVAKAQKMAAPKHRWGFHRQKAKTES
jgi:hypothetical protein